MATLHVRNVPDSLYEVLRESAEREGRSIGAQTIMLLQYGLMDRRTVPDSVAGLVGRRRTPFLQRFAPGGRRAVARAEDEARALGVAAVEPGHVLVALLDDPSTGRALEGAGVTAAAVRERLRRGEGSPSQIPFSPETKRLLEQALRCSLSMRHDRIGPEHLLFALDNDPLLVELGVPPGSAAIRFQLPAPVAEPPDEYLAVDLDGPAEGWTDRLNEVAAEGWELFSITPTGRDARAILRRG